MTRFVSFIPYFSYSKKAYLTPKKGHGVALYAIIAIENSIGIICGCLSACKPLEAKISPQIFTSTHSSKMDGQPFPFPSLGGVIVKEHGCSGE